MSFGSGVRARPRRQAPALLAVTALVVLAPACSGEIRLGGLPSAQTGGATSGADHDATDTVDATGTSGGPAADGSKLDVLFVIDDSPSSIELHRHLGQTFRAWGEALEAVPDLRVAVTSTTVAQGACPESRRATPGWSSCRQRAASFGPEFGELCATRCELERLGPAEGPALWLDRSAGHAAALADEFACALPQGVSGCEFQAPLEAGLQVIEASRKIEDDPLFGWVREDAALLVVYVSEGIDCSTADPVGRDAFSPDGARALWSDPAASAPTEAVCWRGGVLCEGTEGIGPCAPANLDANGTPTDDDAGAVLRPLDRYTGHFEELAGEKAPFGGLQVVVVGGVQPDGAVQYAVPDAIDEERYGIAPGCDAGPLVPRPPVRLAAAGSVVGARMVSACGGMSDLESSLTPALERLGC